MGLDALVKFAPTTGWVMIHDGARPLVTPSIPEAGLRAAQEYQAAIAAVPVKDTIKQVHQGRIETTLDRSQLWAIQTPQVFSLSLIHHAHHPPQAQPDVTDHAPFLQQLVHHVASLPASYTTTKITPPQHLLLPQPP